MTRRRQGEPAEAADEITRLVAQLRETEERLRILTGGEVDAVVDDAGISHLLVAGQRALHQTAESERAAAMTIGAILDALPAHIALLDGRGTILVVNEAWRRFGLAESAVLERAGVGMNYLEVCGAATGEAGADARAVEAGLRRVLAGDPGPFVHEYPCHSPTEQRWFRLVATPAQVAGAPGVAVMHLDITSRELADRAMRASEAESRATFEHAGLGICHVTPDGRFLRVNDAYCQILGYTREELLQLGWRDVTHPEDLATSDQEARSLLALERPQAAFEKRYLKRSGGIVWGRVTTSLVQDLEGRPRYFVSVMEDVTAQRESAERLRRLNRLYRVLSESNAAIIRSLRPQTLYDETCRIAVTEGELPLAAVLLRDPERPTLRPVAVYGAPREYVDALEIRLDDPDSIVGPIGVALQTGVHDICADFATDPRMGAWRDRALAIGFRSAAAFPLRRDGQVLGVFVIWTRERDYFRPDELALLDSVATNLSFALVALAQSEAKQQAEARLRESEERYRDLVENSRDVIWSVDVEGRITFINEACRDVYGYGPEELIGRSFLDFVPEEQQALDRAEMGRSLAEGSSTAEYESQVRRKDGTLAFLLATSRTVTDPEGRVIGFTGISKDVTDRRRAAQQIAEQAALLDQANDAIILKGLDDRILFWSRGAERIYGWSRAEALQATSQQLLMVDPTAYADAKRRLLENGEWSGELEKTRRDGRRLLVDCRWSVTRDPQGAAKAILAIDSDITDRKELERQFLRAQRLENIGTLAGGIAHDLNNVFAPILLSMELLRATYPGPEDAELLDTVEHSARRGADLVRQVLSFARGAEGPRVAVDPRSLVREIGQVVRETFPKRIAFESEAAPDLWPIVGDPTQLHQVLLNLCVNARDAMPDGGTLRIRLTNALLDDVYAGMNPEARAGSWLMIEVSDTGTGIPAELRDRIFDPFFTTKEVGKGTGLGLSTALGIVKSHRGFMNVYSEPGRGTTFKVYIPAEATANVTDAHVVEHSSLPRGNGELILLVDDEESIRDIAFRTLTRFDYRVLLAQNGAEAVALYAQHPNEIAAVITDMAMPVMDGPATIRALRAIRPGVKVIGSSGLTSNGGISRALGAGVEEFIPKPYTAGALLGALRRVIARH